ncbi:ribosome recycling factor [bacterium]|nr:ribosome recycling factor [bacterium]
MPTIDDVYLEADERMEKTVSNTQEELAHLRAGRANPALLDRVMVEAYETKTPLNQLANISTPDASNLVVNPYDPHILKSIERGILQSDLGLTPINDGRILRINIPQPTDERRKELVKIAGRIAEDGKVALRNIRRDAIDKNKKLEKAKEIGEDDLRRANDEIDKLTETYIEQIDDLFKQKAGEIEEF